MFSFTLKFLSRRPNNLRIIALKTTKRNQTFYDGEPNSLVGVCHLPLEPAFCEHTRQIIINTANELGISCHKTGTVVTIEGPRFSSKAESKMHRMWGGSVVNMTTVPEVILAKEAGMCYAAIALATDYDCWRNNAETVCVSEVLAIFKKNVSKVTNLITAVVPRIAKEDWNSTITKLKETVEGNIMKH